MISVIKEEGIKKLFEKVSTNGDICDDTMKVLQQEMVPYYCERRATLDGKVYIVNTITDHTYWSESSSTKVQPVPIGVNNSDTKYMQPNGYIWAITSKQSSVHESKISKDNMDEVKKSIVSMLSAIKSAGRMLSNHNISSGMVITLNRLQNSIDILEKEIYIGNKNRYFETVAIIAEDANIITKLVAMYGPNEEPQSQSIESSRRLSVLAHEMLLSAGIAASIWEPPDAILRLIKCILSYFVVLEIIVRDFLKSEPNMYKRASIGELGNGVRTSSHVENNASLAKILAGSRFQNTNRLNSTLTLESDFSHTISSSLDRPYSLQIIQKIISNESHIKNPENTDTNGVNGLINGTSYFQNEHQRLSSNLRVNQNYYRRNIKSTIASQRYENTRRASSTLLESETNKISADFETLSKGEGDLIKPNTGKLSISLAHQEDLLDPGCNEKSLIFSSCMLPGLEETNVALSKHLLMTKNQASYLLKRYSSFEKSQTQYESMDKVSRHLGVYCKRMTSNLGEFLGKVNQAEYIIRAYKVDEDKISFTEALDEDPENISKYISGCDTPDADTYDHPETGKRHIQTELLRLQKLREEVQFLSMDIVVAVQDLLFLSPQLYINSVLHNGPKEEQAAGENISTEICRSHESGEEIDPNLNKSRNIKYGREARGGLRETVLDSSVFSLDIPFKNSHQDANTNPSPYLDNTSLYTDSQHEQPTKAFDLDSKTHSVLVSHPFALFRPDSTERNTGFLSKLNQLTILLLRLDTTCLKLWLSVKYIFEICDKKTIETLLKCATPRNSVIKGGYRSTMNQNSHLSNSGGQFNITQDAPLVFSNVELQRKHQPLLVNPKLDSNFSKPSGLNSNTFSTVRPASTKLSVQNNVSRMFSYKKIKNFVKNFKKPSKGTILSSKRESGLDPTSDTFGKKRSAFEMGRSISSRPSSISELQELTEDIYHNGLVFDSKKRVKCGTLENLVGYLTSDTMLDEDFISTFMLTFHAFISSPRFFNLLIDRYMISPPDNLQPDEMITWRERKLSVVRLKVINVFKTWLREYFEPRLEGDIEALNMLRTFASTVIVESYPRLAESLIVEIDIISSSTESRQSGLPANTSSLTEEEFSEYHQNAHIYSFYNFLNHKSSKYSLFEGARKNDNIVRQPISYIPENLDAAQRLIDVINPRELARQITLINFNLLSKIKPIEFLRKAWARSYFDPKAVNGLTVEISCNIRMVSLFSTRVTNFIISSVLSETDVYMRAKTIKYYITVGENLWLLHNYDCLMSLVAALKSTPLSRLYKTWKLVPKPSIDSFSSLSTVVNPSKNFSEYRTSIQKISPPAIPYLGLVLSDLTFIEDGNSDYLGKDSHSSELLNFSKFESIASSIRAVLNFQSVSYMTKLTLAPDVISLFFNKLKSEVPISASHDNLMEQFLQTANKLEPK